MTSPDGSFVKHDGSPMGATSGFTLFEVLVALLILAVGVAWSLQSTAMGLRVSQQTHTNLLVQKGVLEYELESLRSRPWATLTAYQATNPNSLNPKPPLMDPGDPLVGVLSSVVQSAQFWVEDLDPASPNTRLKRVRIVVTWKDQDQRLITSTVSTLIGCDGLTDANPNTQDCP